MSGAAARIGKMAKCVAAGGVVISTKMSCASYAECGIWALGILTICRVPDPRQVS